MLLSILLVSLNLSLSLASQSAGLSLLLLGIIPPNLSQLAMASSNYFNNPPWSLPSSIGERDTHSMMFSSSLRDLENPKPKHDMSGIESEIAAIFKGVAYGSSTAKSTPKATTSTTTTTEKPSTTLRYYYGETTEEESFIGKQKEVQVEGEVVRQYSINENIANNSIEPINIPILEYYSPQNESGYTYLIHSDPYIADKDHNEMVLSHRTPIPVVENVPSLEIQEMGSIKPEIRKSNKLKKEGFESIQGEVGRAWAFHIYVTGVAFVLVSIVCLLSLSRVSACSQLLPRGYFITLHLMIFLSAFFRCLLFLHDPYGAYERLPLVLTDLLFNTVGPCITTAYALVLLVLLRAARIKLLPLNMQSPLVLATICGIHIGGTVVVDVSSGVLENDNTIMMLNIITRSFTVSWGIILCLGYVISFNSVEKAALKHHGDTVRLTYNRTALEGGSLPRMPVRSSLTYASRIFLICSLLQGLLIAFIILSLVTTRLPLSPSVSEAWAWWTQSSLERLIEIALCVLLLATALVLTQNKPKASVPNNPKVFSIFTNCGKNTNSPKAGDIYPIAKDNFNILKNGTLTNSTLNSSLNYSSTAWKGLNESTLSKSVINGPSVLTSVDAEYQKIVHQDGKADPNFLYTPQLLYDSNTYMQQTNVAKDLMYFNLIKDHNTWKKQQEKLYHPHMNNYDINRTLSNYTHHANNQSSPPHKLNTIRADIYQPKNNRNVQAPCDLPISCPPIQITSAHCDVNQSQPECEYEVSSYYTNSNASTASSNIYTRPYTYYCNNPMTYEPHSQNLSSNYPQNYPQTHQFINPKQSGGHPSLHSRSEHSCYSDQSEAHVDYLTDISSSNDGLNGTLSRSFTLPLHPQNTLNQSICSPNNTHDRVHSNKTSLNPRVPYLHGEIPIHHAQDISPDRIQSPSSPLEFIKSSTNSLNDVLKTQSGFLGKLVQGNGSSLVGYSPLSLDESSISPSTTTNDTTSSLRRTTSTGNLNSLDIPPKEDNQQKHSKRSVPKVHSTDPVTCL